MNIPGKHTRVLAVGTINVDILATELPNVAAEGRMVYCATPIRSQIGGHPVDVGIDLINLGFPREDVAVVAALGTGPQSEFVQGIMRDHGLTVYAKNVPDVDTGTNMVLKVVGEDRRFHLDPGANWRLDAEHAIAAITDFRPEILCIRGGYTDLDIRMDEVLQSVDGLTFLDICPPHPDRDPEFIGRALAFTDIVHCNAIELQLVSGRQTLRDGLAWLLDSGVQIAFVSNGEHGITAVNHEAGVQQDAFQVAAIDPTGAGDAFCAGVVDELNRNPELRSNLATLDADELADLLVRPQAVGAAATTKVGCIGGATSERVEALMDQQAAHVRNSTRSAILSEGLTAEATNT